MSLEVRQLLRTLISGTTQAENSLNANRFQETITTADATTAVQVKAKTAAKKMYVLSLLVTTDTAMGIQFQDDSGPAVLIEQMYVGANQGFSMTWHKDAPLVVDTNTDLDVLATAAGNISVHIAGYLAD